MILSPKPKSKFKVFKSQTLDTGFRKQEALLIFQAKIVAK